MGSTVVVTCGATVPFPELIAALLDKQVLDTLLRMQYTKLIVQYGRGFTSEFKQLLDCVGARLEASTNGKTPTLAAGVEVQVRAHFQALEICGFEFTGAIHQLLRDEADLVISHAGTGSIVDALRLGKRLLVVANTSLMDNHQLQIALKFESRGHLQSAAAQPKALIAALREVETAPQAPLPHGYNSSFERLLMDVAQS
ncbi:LAQU0S01e12948g1_1 [Lachancea quebecensis]|uniref:UDP-N-acetylglucosamine transferase subunit ALG13 n=1 Tax=Lachancea quebecensis TaxID=1654605 RepID=A0A0P1KLY3_9SACH|nr:LAQU0S01e12948g1_1 [Lachancea quebecensis]